MKLGFSLMEDNNVLANYLLQASIQSMVVYASASLLKCRDGKQSQAHCLHILGSASSPDSI